MGTDVDVILPADVGSAELSRWAAEVESLFSELDRRFSRFREDSELTRLNARAGRTVEVSSGFAALLGFALRGAAETDGLFDPTVLPALTAAGYDRDFDEIEVEATPRIRPVPPPAPARAWHEIRLVGRRVFLPEGVALDFGGVAKGWAVDQVAERLSGLDWALVNAGGDLRVVGRPPPGEVLVGVEHPLEPGAEVGRVLLRGGAVATSSVTRRSWGAGRHHLIDPRTWLPADTGVLQATVWAPTCAEAEIRSKWALLAGPEILGEIPALLVMEDGRYLHSLPTDEPAEVGP
jgi:thiamine biosynthesis lipoprotein